MATSYLMACALPHTHTHSDSLAAPAPIARLTVTDSLPASLTAHNNQQSTSQSQAQLTQTNNLHSLTHSLTDSHSNSLKTQTQTQTQNSRWRSLLFAVRIWNLEFGSFIHRGHSLTHSQSNQSIADSTPPRGVCRSLSVCLNTLVQVWSFCVLYFFISSLT